MMEQEAASQTMYIAAMGTEYTFKATAASAKVVFALIKAISEKVKLSTADKKLLKIASDGVAAGVTLKTEDLKTFKSMANAFGLTFCVVGSKHSVEAGLTDIMVRQDQIARVNDCLSRLGYGNVKEAESTKKESPSLSDLSKQTPELENEAGISELWGEDKKGYKPVLPEEGRDKSFAGESLKGNPEMESERAEYEAATLRYKTAFEALPKGDNKGSLDSVKSKAAYAEFDTAFVEFQSAADRYKSMHEKLKNANGKTGKVSRVETAFEALPKDEWEWEDKARNPNTDMETLRALAQDDDPFVRLEVAKTQNADGETLCTLVRDKDPDVRAAVAKNQNTDIGTLRALAQDPVPGVRYAVAENPNTDKETLCALSKDEFWGVQSAVAANPNTNVGTLQSDADHYKSMHEKLKNTNGKTGKVSRVESAIEKATAKAELFNAAKSLEKVSEVVKSVPMTDLPVK